MKTKIALAAAAAPSLSGGSAGAQTVYPPAGRSNASSVLTCVRSYFGWLWARRPTGERSILSNGSSGWCPTLVPPSHLDWEDRSRPSTDLKDRLCERTVSARKRSSAESRKLRKRLFRALARSPYRSKIS